MKKPRLEARKSVVFNLANDTERTMWEYASRANFSQLVRKYLLSDMRKKEVPAQASIVVHSNDTMNQDDHC